MKNGHEMQGSVKLWRLTCGLIGKISHMRCRLPISRSRPSHVQYCPHIIAEVKLGMVKGIYSSFCPEDLHLFSRIKILDSRFWVYSSFSDSKLLPYYLSHPYPTAISELNWPLPLILNPYSFSAVHIHLSEILFSWFWKRNPKIWIFLYRGSTGIIFLFTYLYFTSS